MPPVAPALEIPSSLRWAHPVTAEWFVRKFGTPTEPQEAGWPSILAGDTTLISAPTGSGKTLAAFLVCIDQLLRQAIDGRLAPVTQVVYVSPLKALSNDVQKNLDAPLAEIQQLALERGYLSTGVRTGVRTGDTLPKERAAMLRNPPHILVTTPESLYILLTAGKSRENLRHVRTIIVDEIHAVADDKRGSHLALSLERLDALVCGENRLSPGAFLTGMATPPLRIGLSATQNPIELVAEFLTGSALHRKSANIIQAGRRRNLDLGIEVPSDELGSVATIPMWEEVFDKLAALTGHHRSTLVFVNTRKLVERISFALSERLGQQHVAAHHGSLSRTLRLDAEQRLKNGEIKVLVATASLELGIDIGNVDLVCQINTTRAIAVAMQRVGRAGHWRGATPKGRFFTMTRDDLMEQAALIRKMRAGELDRLEIPEAPIDVLMQQIVASVAAEPWEEEALFRVLQRAYPYRNLTREHFDELLTLLHEGIESSRGRYGAYILRDRVQGILHPRRGARMLSICNGGAIPDNSNFALVLQPEGLQIGTLDEHFAVESSPGDVILFGNTSWRVQRVEAAGRVLVEDAHGAPPTLPFWEGEAPQRTGVLSDGVAELRAEIDARTRNVAPDMATAINAEVSACIDWLKEECAVNDSAALQMVRFIVNGRAVLGAVPTKQTIIAERFFDEGGGQQLILHAPFGGRINKAWGLALRKRFCRGFNFELQAAATDNGINISLAEQHSFPLADIFRFLTDLTAKELLEQAAIPSPLFKARWRWAAGRSLQLLRFSKGKRIAPQIQRTRSEDLLASVFPHAAACPETMEGNIEIPNHPLVREVMKDTLTEAMDIDGLIEILKAMEAGTIRCLAVDTPVPSQFAHELINAQPYAFLDDAGTEERRARAVSLRRALPSSIADDAGKLDPAAIRTVRQQLWPDLRDHHELHDLLLSLTVLPTLFLSAGGNGKGNSTRDWPLFFDRLVETGRASLLHCNGVDCWVTTARLPHAAALYGDTSSISKDEAIKQAVRGWLQVLGPTTSSNLAGLLAVEPSSIFQALLAMEIQGLALRGTFEYPATSDDLRIEWCERRVLQRIHRLTLQTLRKQVEAVTPAVYMDWLLRWQHLAPQTQLAGEEGVLTALEQLEGFEAPAIEWERALLSQRVSQYDRRWLDNLCLSGTVGWGRVSPHPAWSAASQQVGEGTARPRRVIPTNAAPITFYIRETAAWLPHALAAKSIDESTLAQALSPNALRIRGVLQHRGACFTNDLQRIAALDAREVKNALWELATAGLAAADGFDQLRAMMDPRRKVSINPREGRRNLRTTAGRWSLLTTEDHSFDTAIETARRADAAIESHARVLLRRYGILFRDVLEREATAPRWRDLLGILRRLEGRGEIRGGRFVSGFGGEQYALPEAVESLRLQRRKSEKERSEPEIITVSAADPTNLAGIILPGSRVPAMPGKTVDFRGGTLLNAIDPAATLPPQSDNPPPKPEAARLFQA